MKYHIEVMTIPALRVPSIVAAYAPPNPLAIERISMFWRDPLVRISDALQRTVVGQGHPLEASVVGGGNDRSIQLLSCL